MVAGRPEEKPAGRPGGKREGGPVKKKDVEHVARRAT